MSLQHRVWWSLFDGEWHKLSELVELSKDLIRPERAVKVGKGEQLEERYRHGLRKCMVDCVNTMSNLGFIEMRKDDLNPHGGCGMITAVRLVPDAWNLVLNNPQQLGRIVGELGDMLRKGRVQISVKVLPKNGGTT